jgi:hypothetical protein
VNYIHRAQRVVDERAFAVLTEYLNGIAGAQAMTFGEFKNALRTQALIVGQNAEAALLALPDLLPIDQTARERLLETIRRVATVGGPVSGATAERLTQIEEIFAMPADRSVVRSLRSAGAEALAMSDSGRPDLGAEDGIQQVARRARGSR